MDGAVIIIILAFLGILTHQILSIRDMIIPSRIKKLDRIILIIFSLGILRFAYLKADNWTKYIVGILFAIIMQLSLPKVGIRSKGISYIGRGLIGFIPWQKLKEVRVWQDKDVRIAFQARGYQILYFKRDDYDRIIYILKQKLPEEKITTHIKL